MLASDSMELVERCYEQVCSLLGKEDLKNKFIDYVFVDYQEEVVAEYDADFFYQHLQKLQLIRCRKDFDQAVEAWYEKKRLGNNRSTGFHSILFSIVRKTIGMYKIRNRQELIKYVTHVLTNSNGYMKQWRSKGKRTKVMYFHYLYKIGIRNGKDIEALVDSWLIENPQAFDEYQQAYYQRPIRRGRPNNVQLSRLIDQIKQMKPALNRKERERIRKIFYYYRNHLEINGMVSKFLNYIEAKDRKNQCDKKENNQLANNLLSQTRENETISRNI
ncbi:hypothetical protein [Brevibacillus laterosporus]|uniref:Uncharacterized protein n=1 Tax=Brevibacillus laterosporus LMG 15441 TaxID=1042163 RepID=A0A075QY38_BRELA|nr:hypothetical protein [Brevibacillus laterosporus]AIG24534.1 hypothetical protein BRLA_c001190 [Brevibacillus laterosporus LMG 15441]